jgi:uncharacterized protein with NAD-binding domain and iron-sulfur cluster
MLSQKARTILLMATIIAMVACAPLILPSGNTPAPTLATGELEVIIAQTAAKAASETAILIPPTLTPTLTPSPTVTASLTPSPTATFIFLLPTYTIIPPGSHPGGTVTGIDGPLNKGFSCKIISADPPPDDVIPAGKLFNAHWVVQNDGTESWDSANMDYLYTSGQKMHVGSKVRDLDASIASGETLEIIVQMKAPQAPGSYTTVWELHSEQERFCPMTITITV